MSSTWCRDFSTHYRRSIANLKRLISKPSSGLGAANYMARINFEDRVFKEQGFQDLMIEVRSRLLAKGIVLELFSLAQEFWFPNRLPIPMDRFKAAGLPEILFAPAGLCELVNGDVYVRGSKDAFQWLFDASHAGKMSAEARKKKSGTSQPKKMRQKKTETLERPSNGVERPSNGVQARSTSLLSSLTLSSSLSSPDSSSSLSLFSEGLKEAPSLSIQDPSPTALTWRAYKAAYLHRYRAEPTWNSKVAGQIKNFVARVPVEDAPLIAAFYLSHNGARYTGSCHSVGIMLMDAEKLRTEWLTGSRITSIDSRNIEAGDALKNQIERLTRGN